MTSAFQDTTPEEVRNEMSQIQEEMRKALQEIITEVGSKLKPQERKEIESEFAELDEMLERLKSGLIWIALFGNTSVGKSAIANSLIKKDDGEDGAAKVGVQHDLTEEPKAYIHKPWKIVDVPGILGKKVNEEIALKEARKAHGHIFVIKGEPYGPELDLFDLVHKALPTAPKIVFVNQWDVIQAANTTEEVDIIRERIAQKMGKFVSSPQDIVYGNALLKEGNIKVRQELPKLIERMYENAGTLGKVMNVIDPANRFTSLNGKINEKVLEVRLKVARKIIAGCSLVTAFSTAIPFGDIVGTPVIWVAMVVAISSVVGKKLDKASAGKVVQQVFKACAETLGVVFVASVAGVALLDVVTTTLSPFFGLGAFLGLVADVAFLGVWKYRRTAVLGEVTIEYIRNNYSWGAEGANVVIKRCYERASQHYSYLQDKRAKTGKESELINP